ncbi:hypothetical protein QUB60_01530 [Microcoleus sp. A2-C5]
MEVYSWVNTRDRHLEPIAPQLPSPIPTPTTIVNKNFTKLTKSPNTS